MANNPDTVHPFHWIGIRKDWLSHGGSLVNLLVRLQPASLATHALIIGATGSGKSNLIYHMIAQDILLGHSFSILDMRGDLVSASIALAAGRVEPKKVALFDLRERERPLGFNPLYGAGEPYFRALAVLDAVAAEHDSWGVQLAESLRYAVLLLAETGEPLSNIEALFYDEIYRATITCRSTDHSVIDFWERYAALKKEKQVALATPVLNKVSLLLSTPSLRKTFGSSSPLDLGKHLNTNGSITLVSLAVDELHGAGRMFGNMVLSAMCREIFARVHIDEHLRNPVRLYVDEFEHFGTHEFENILAEGRRFGLSLIVAHQTLAQLTPRLRSMILNNVGTKVVFRTGREDSATLSKDLTGDSKAIDLTTLPVGEAILWRRNQELITVEVNGPIIKGGGRPSAFTREFIDAIRASQPQAEEQPVLSGVAKLIKAEPQSPAHVRSVEEWL